jgi:glycosyltransferase involved in cell wall biosynthesis
VRFAGYVPEAEKVDYYRVADVFVSTSELEGFGFTVAEAMACGLPVVVSNRGALPEIVESGQGGILCDPKDHPAFARSVLGLLADATVRERFGAANRARVERLFRWEVCAREVRRVYEDALSAWRRDRVEGAAGV